jgi:hypothetical protein
VCPASRGEFALFILCAPRSRIADRALVPMSPSSPRGQRPALVCVSCRVSVMRSCCCGRYLSFSAPRPGTLFTFLVPMLRWYDPCPVRPGFTCFFPDLVVACRSAVMRWGSIELSSYGACSMSGYSTSNIPAGHLVCLGLVRVPFLGGPGLALVLSYCLCYCPRSVRFACH